MPRKTRRQLVGKHEDIERQEREDGLQALEDELHRLQIETIDNLLPLATEPGEMAVSLI